MADDMDAGEQKSSKLKTFLLVGAAVAAAFAMPAILGSIAGGGLLVGAIPGVASAASWLTGGGSMIASVAGAAVRWGIPAMLAGKAWKSHKENQMIDAENAAAGQSYSSGLSPQQERALAIAQMQEADSAPSTRFRDAEMSRRAYSQNVR